MHTRKGIKLRNVIGLLVAGTVILTAAFSGYFSINTNRDLLTQSYLESNYQYAQKVASNTTELLQVMQDNIEMIAEQAASSDFSNKDLEIWFSANKHYFNSLFIVNEERVIKMITSNVKGLAPGEQLNSEAAIEASNKRAFLISSPYVGITGRLIVLVATPVVATNGSYAGFVGGTLYLEEDNSLNTALNQHFSDNGSYVYVADQGGHLIFHPDKSRLHEVILNNEVINKAIAGGSGKQRVTNSQGNTFFAGYSFESKSGWAIVSQTPTDVLEGPMRKLVQKMIMQALPVMAIVLLFAWRVSLHISKPLYNLAKFSEETGSAASPVTAKLPMIQSSIYEVKQLNQSIAKHLELLNSEITRDGLTGLTNRKTFNVIMEQYFQDGIPFSLILIDIDHFKQVNDTHGHQIGDDVLKFLAAQMLLFAGDNDICFRYGGEEFGILIPGENLKSSAALAERFRIHLTETASPTGQPIHVSIGIAHSDMRPGCSRELVELADKALYLSKELGRNRVTVWQDERALSV